MMAEKIKKNISELPNKEVAGKFRMLSIAPVINKTRATVVSPVFFVVFSFLPSICICFNHIQVKYYKHILVLCKIN